MANNPFFFGFCSGVAMVALAFFVAYFWVGRHFLRSWAEMLRSIGSV